MIEVHVNLDSPEQRIRVPEALEAGYLAVALESVFRMLSTWRLMGLRKHLQLGFYSPT